MHVACRTLGTVRAVAVAASSGTSLALLGSGIAEVISRTGLLAFASALEAEVGRRTVVDAAKGRIIFVVVCGESRAVCQALAQVKVEIRLASRAVFGIYAGEALSGAFSACHSS